MKLDRDDPRLTAYIMGELDAAEAKAVEEAVNSDEELRRFVDELRGVAMMSQEALTEADGPALTNVQRDAIMAQAASEPAPRSSWVRRVSMVLLPVAACALFVASVVYLYGSAPVPAGEEQLLGTADNEFSAGMAGDGIPAEVRDQMEVLVSLEGEDGEAKKTEAGAIVDALSVAKPEAKPDAVVAGKLEEESDEFSEFDLGESDDFDAFDYSAGGGSASGAGGGGAGAYRVAGAKDLEDAEDKGDAEKSEVRVAAEAALKEESAPAKRAEERPASGLRLSEEMREGDILKKPQQIAMNGPEVPVGELLDDGADAFIAGRPQPEPKPTRAEAPVEERIRLGGNLRYAPAGGRKDVRGTDDVEVYQAYIEAPKMEQGDKLARIAGHVEGVAEIDNVAQAGVIEQRTRLNFRAGVTNESLQFGINGDGAKEEIPFYTKPDGKLGVMYRVADADASKQRRMHLGTGLRFGAEYSTHARPQVWGWAEAGTESYAMVAESPFLRVLDQPLSTFSIDVDTASYTNIRRFLNDGSWPPPGAVRIEEMVNYFSYDYPKPSREHPFSVNVDVGPCPWTPEHRLARIGLKGREVALEEHEGVNLVFLLDVSGSMDKHNKLPLLKEAMTLLAKRLGERDRVAIVTYRDTAKTVLESTPCDKRKKVLRAIDGLEAKGSTNGGAGIELAYGMAGESFITGGINRVILATDGDFNVGTTEDDALVRLITQRAQGKVFLTVLGFGTDNIKDDKLEALADKGNGSYHYIDSFKEARRVLVRQMAGTLATIAKDVKIQVEFNPAKVGAYRLIGYENRALAARDFNDDRKDAGEIGSGHTVTALYELMPPGDGIHEPGVDPLKYQRPVEPPVEIADSPELMTVKLRYKAPEGDESKLIQVAVAAPEAFEEGAAFESKESRFAAAVAAFGMALRGSPHAQDMQLADIIELAESGKGRDNDGEREEFVDLVVTAKTLLNVKRTTDN
jgi:Ca-activated chloride channel homolog